MNRRINKIDQYELSNIIYLDYCTAESLNKHYLVRKHKFILLFIMYNPVHIFNFFRYTTLTVGFYSRLTNVAAAMPWNWMVVRPALIFY